MKCQDLFSLKKKKNRMSSATSRRPGILLVLLKVNFASNKCFFFLFFCLKIGLDISVDLSFILI